MMIECDGDLKAGVNCDGAIVSLGYTPLFGYNHPDSEPYLNPDYIVEPINVKENVVTGMYETITICERSWSKEFLDDFKDNPTKNRPCVTVTYDTDSMKGYSDNGFKNNYCAENKADFKDTMEDICVWGGMGAAVGVSLMSGGVTGTVIIPVAIGSTSVACEKLLQMSEKWPSDQY